MIPLPRGFWLDDDEAAAFAAMAALIRREWRRQGLPVPVLIEVPLSGFERRRAAAVAAVTGQVPTGSAPVPILAGDGSAPAPSSWWSTATAASELGVSPRAVVKAVQAGSLRARRGRGDAWRIDPASVAEYAQARRARSGQAA